jgi:hypothetical protein
MRPQISNYISTFSDRSRRTIQSVLSESYLEKAEIGRLINKVSAFAAPADYAPRLVAPLEPIQREVLIDMFRDMDLRVKGQFDISNSISLLGSSMVNVFGGELQKIEKDLDYLNAYVNNYSFISGEDDLFNSSFIENFDNESNSYLSQNAQGEQTTVVSDRSLIPFRLEEAAKVDPFAGVLKFSSQYETTLQSIQVEDVKEISYDTNFSPNYVTTNTGVEKILNNLNNKSWTVTVKSPFIIRESILDREEYFSYKNGVVVPPSAQIALKIKFNRLIPIARLRINPNYATGMQVAQIIVDTESSNQSGNSSGTQTKKGLLNSAILLEQNFDIDFDQTYMVKELIIILAQTVYTRTKLMPVQTELNSKIVSEIVKEIRNRRKEKHDSLQDYVIKFFLRDTEKAFVIRNKKLYNYNYTEYYPTSLSETNFGAIEKLDRGSYFSDLDSFNKFKNTSLLSNIVFSIIAYSLGSRLRNQLSSTYIESNLTDNVKTFGRYSSSGLVPLGDSNIVDANLHFVEQTMLSLSKDEASQIMNSSEDRMLYEYTFSLKDIAFYLFSNSNESQPASPITRSFFVSRKVPTNGRPLKVKMLANYFQELQRSRNDYSQDKTSVEFSVCVQDDFSIESNWIPIIPFTDEFIRTELLFPNSAGECTLRFEPSIETILLYEDRTLKASGSYTVTGSIFKISNYNSNKKYYISYKPNNINNFKEIKLNINSIDAPVLAMPNSQGANGERFSSTSTGNRVRLSYIPYIDQSKFLGATYSPIVGTITSVRTSFGNYDNSNYSPVKVVFDDGTTATNMTNYILSDYQTESFNQGSGIMFIHAGDTLTFNTAVNQGFRVLYQYMPDSFRYRVILRSLTSDAENYTVNRLIFKFSTDVNDSQLTNLIKYDNLYKNKTT